MAEKILAGSARHLELKAGIRKIDYLMINFPFLCNYRCTKCCNFGREGKGKEPFSLTEIEEILKQAKELGARVLVIAGEGEPLMYSKIKEVVKSSFDNGLIPYIFTNGSMLTVPMIKFLKENNTSLIINCDSMNEEQYDKLSGSKGSFKTLMKNLANVRKYFAGTWEKIRGNEIRRIAINTVVSGINHNQVQKVIDFCGEDFAFVLNRPINIGKAKNNPAFCSQKDAEEILQKHQNHAPLGKAMNGTWCTYMRNGISVGSNGDILTCAYSLESAGKFGNIKGKKLRDFIGAANKAVDKFYSREEHHHCILRHPNYKKFITDL